MIYFQDTSHLSFYCLPPRGMSDDVGEEEDQDDDTGMFNTALL